MKKFTKVLALTLVAIMCLAFFAGCGVNENTAERINKAAEEGKYLTYEELVKSYGEPTVGASLGGGDNIFGVSGVIIWANGCKTADDIEAKLDAGKTVTQLEVMFLNGKATSATYREVTPSEK